jgi:hypothetical protein
VFELGLALRAVPNRVMVSSALAQRYVDLHTRWVADAKAAIECWIAAARSLGVCRDVRRLIARMAWEDRAAWSASQMTP